MSRVGEWVLGALSRPPEAEDHAAARDPWNQANALDILRAAFPDLEALVRGRRVLDFGCGGGWQALALAGLGAGFVLGIDSNERVLRSARSLARRMGTDPRRLRFAAALPPALAGSFDVVISQNAMEHFGDPVGVLRAMRGALAPGGRVLVTFGPPWLAPSGSHMHFFTRVPWVNLLFSERTVMAVRARYRHDGARRYEEVESGLNRMTLRRFERVVRASGLRIERRADRCVKGLPLLHRVPVIRELAVNVVNAVLVPRDPPRRTFGAGAQHLPPASDENSGPPVPPQSASPSPAVV
ncbi:MAG TPA: class I SAM-dependent methyltransferase [Longimicrobium sp.]|nr:class I SAM-dependent methyltransferase [Longimicrobium sp.]